jgi:cysteine-rich repeat protein
VLLAALIVYPALSAALPTVTLQPVTTAVAPVYVAHAGDDRLFIVERAGRILVRQGGVTLPTPFLDIRTLVDDSLDGGLYTVAFHPRYAENGLFFVAYTETSAPLRAVIARYQVSGADPNVADPASGRVLLTLDQPHGSHNNGQVAFGPDGYLWVIFGDGGPGGGPGCRSQFDDVWFGKMLRLDVDRSLDGTPYYGIPVDNPFADPGDGILDEIWAKGFRNPWRFSFDRARGDLWLPDVGQSTAEELNLEPAGDPGGRNYGWKVMEGTTCFTPFPTLGGCPASTPPCGDPAYTNPIFEYPTGGNGDCSIIGGYRYRGASTEARGLYVFGDYCSGRVWVLEEGPPGTFTRTEIASAGFGVTSFGEGADGEIYVTVGNAVRHLAFSGPVDAGTCGDGMVVGVEQCDDGGTAAGDGCDPSCRIEIGATCAGEPSACTRRREHYVLHGVRASKRPDLPDDGRFPGPGWNVRLDDVVLADGAADDPEHYEVKRERQLALAASADGAPAPLAPDAHYVVYDLREAAEGAGAFDPSKGKYPRAVAHHKRTWSLSSRLGDVRVTSRKVRALWVPAAMASGAPPPAPSDADHFICYDAKATTDVTAQTPDGGNGKGRFRRDLQSFARDPFLAEDCATDRDGAVTFAGSAVEGDCLFTLKRPRLLCAPAAKAEVGGDPPRATIATVDGSTPASATAMLCYQVKLATRLQSQTLLDAGVLDGQMPPAMLFDRYRQRRHVMRALAQGTAPHLTPGNGFPAPRQVDTLTTDLLCVPSAVDGVEG